MSVRGRGGDAREQLRGCGRSDPDPPASQNRLATTIVGVAALRALEQPLDDLRRVLQVAVHDARPTRRGPYGCRRRRRRRGRRSGPCRRGAAGARSASTRGTRRPRSSGVPSSLSSTKMISIVTCGMTRSSAATSSTTLRSSLRVGTTTESRGRRPAGGALWPLRPSSDGVSSCTVCGTGGVIDSMASLRSLEVCSGRCGPSWPSWPPGGPSAARRRRGRTRPAGTATRGRAP